MNLTENQIEIIRHTIGLDRSSRSYRNRYIASAGHHNFDDLESLVKCGAMEKYDGSGLFGKSSIYIATKSGANAVLKKGEALCSEDFPE